MPKRAKSKRLAAVAMNSMAQQAVPKGIGHRELARAQLTRSSSRVSSQLGLWPATSVVSTTCFMIQPRRVKGVRRNLSVPFQRPPFPNGDGAHGENQDEHQHLHEQEPRPYPEGARLPEDRRPGEQEHGLDVEDDEEHRDEIELHGEPLARVPERRHTALVGELFHGCGPPPRDQMRAGVISYGVSSYGYDMRVAPEFKIFTNALSAVVDPKQFDPKSFVEFNGDVCIVPPNSFALARSVEYFRIPRNVLTICVGKSTYARCGIITNVTPFEPEWEGFVTLEISNTTPLPAKIYANEGIAQVLFFTADEGDECEVSYKDKKGKYQAQRGITLPKL